jgi:hypothetical protein
MLAQMQAFAVEGRLAANSLIAKDSDGRFGPACQDPDLGDLFRPATAGGRSPFNTGGDSGSRPFGHGDGNVSDEPSHFVIVADMKSGSIAALEEELFRLGPAYAVMPLAWVLSADISVGTLKNILVQKLGKLDNLLVVDASHDKLTWSNLGPEADTRLRRIWIKHPNLSAA